MEPKSGALQIRNLCKMFTLNLLEGKTVVGCENINFTVEQGEFLGISGPSGSGKSTIIKCIYRTYLSTSGSILYRTAQGNQIDLAAASEREIIALRHDEISYVSQFLRVIPRVSALDLLAEGLRKKGWAIGAARAEAREHLRMMNLDPALWDAYPAFFSGGEQQRVNLARALIVRPRLLLLDEPTASLDAESKKAVVKALKELKAQGTTLVGIFHDLESMGRLADRVFAMKGGRGGSIERVQEVI
jgi:alpha-D-ribose 1-methylphosphonate 5-triphosphate synthase subunit PhnL